MKKLLCLFVILASVSGLYGQISLNVPVIEQEHSMWCWAACSEMVMRYYGIKHFNGDGLGTLNFQQCDLVNFAFKRSDCCGSDIFDWTYTECNSGNGLFYGPGYNTDDILIRANISTRGIFAPLSWSDVVTEITSKRPFIFSIYYSSGGGHVVVCNSSYIAANGDKYIGYNDPWINEGFTISLYDWVVESEEISWATTLKTSYKKRK